MLIGMPVSSSIGHAIGLGLISYTVIKVFSGKPGEVSILTYVISALFLVKARKRMPVVRAVSPVRPPASTPEADSTKVVTVEVPVQAPATVPLASDSRASFPDPQRGPVHHGLRLWRHGAPGGHHLHRPVRPGSWRRRSCR